MTIIEILATSLKGLAMGAADLVPGVSGGTVALITGIYGRLINSIKCFDVRAFKLLLRGKVLEFIRYVDGIFLLALGFGIAISIFSFARAVDYLLDNYPLVLFSFFIGLISASSIIIIRKIKEWTLTNYISFIFGVIGALLLSTLNEYTTPNSLFFVFLSGIIGVSAMLLPGISGSFILLLMGKYAYMINAVKEFDLPVLFVFALGYMVGGLVFAKVLNWVLKRYFEISLLFLTGLMLGSFNKIWPWRVIDRGNSTIGVGDYVYSKSVLPWEYQSFENADPQIAICVLSVIFGFVLVLLMNWLSYKYSDK